MAVLGLVLMLVMVGGLILPVLLYFMGTASIAGQVVERKTKEYYSANSGIDAALWRIKTNGKLPSWLDNINWGESVYGRNPAYENYTLSFGDPLNDNSVVYQIGPKWVLGDSVNPLETPNGTQRRNPASNIVMAGNYKGTGSVSGRGQYEIIIMYDGTVGALGIKRIGCWLPAGFEYVPGSSSLEKTQYPVKPYYKVPVVTPYRGGHTITWDYQTAVDYDSFDPPGSQRKVTFEFTPNQSLQGEFCWLRTNNTTYNELAWNTDLKVFEVKSTATSPSGQSTMATAYTTKKEFQKYGSAMEGDYYAFGNTLMRYETASDGLSRERLYKETSSTVRNSPIPDIPLNANVEKILLYWSGWKCKPWNTTNYTQAQYKQLIEVDKKVNKVKLKISGVPGVSDYTTTVTASETQGAQNKMDSSPYPIGWSYSCYADITSEVLAHMGASFVGNGTYTVGHWDTGTQSTSRRYRLYNWIDGHPHEEEHNNLYTQYPLGSPRQGDHNFSGYEDVGDPHQAAYGAWSVVIIYTSPSTKGHQIYIYDTLEYVVRNTFTPKVITISGFLTPDLTNEPEAARITTFIGEGDGASNQTDSLSINGSSLWDLDNPINNICNSKSRIPPGTYPDPLTLIDGIDIDTFSIANGIVNPNDTEATVRLTTGPEGLDIIYFIMSFRSKITSGGVYIYNLQ